MYTILVPCDFSSPAKNAFTFALRLAEKSKATVHLLNVIELPVLHDTVLMPVLNFEAAMLEELKQKTDEAIKKMISGSKQSSVEVVGEVAFGSPAMKILEYAEARGVDLIVMGSHGAHGLREFVIGSNAEKIVRRSSVPVLVVKSETDGVVENIVFPNTLETEHQEDLVRKVQELQQFFNATVHIVYVNTPLHFMSDDVTLARLKTFAERYKFVNFTLNVYNHPDEEEGINQFADKVKADLIAIGTHGRTGIAHLVNGSLAEDVANHVDKLIWTYSLKRAATDQ